MSSKSSSCPREKTLHCKKGFFGTHGICLKSFDNIMEPLIHLASKVPERPFPLVSSRRMSIACCNKYFSLTANDQTCKLVVRSFFIGCWTFTLHLTYLHHDWQSLLGLFRLSFNPDEHGGISEIRINPTHLWVPDIVLENRWQIQPNWYRFLLEIFLQIFKCSL